MDKKEQIEAALEEAKSLLENSRLVEAEKKTEAILEEYPNNGEALYLSLIHI